MPTTASPPPDAHFGSFGDFSARLADVYAPCFSLALQLRATQEYGDAEMLRRRIKHLLETTRREAEGTGLAPEDIREAEFALVAFLDETLLSSGWSQKNQWLSNPLQLELYDRFDAGETFFDRLDGMRANPGLHAEVLEVYYLCMALGFKGKYQLHGQEELRMLVEEVQSEVERQPGMAPGQLAPHGQPRGQVATEVRSRVPTWAVVTAVVMLSLVIYLGMTVYMNRTAAEVARDIETVATP
ncbi:MAG: type IVB secretion system protein IcmH/DotU [Bacteroidota bacterium]